MATYIRVGEYIMTEQSVVVVESRGPDDQAAIRALLQSHGLPLAGVDDEHVVLLVARRGGQVVGSAAIEIYGRFGLLRSVAVADALRGIGIGERLTRSAIGWAEAHGLTALYLLTETAAPFFARFGFVSVTRTNIPEAVKQSVEFTSACPASAATLELLLKRSLL